MKRVVLIKTSQDIQTAHAYEHLYCRAIHTLFLKHKLFYYLDYTYQGNAYNNGLVSIRVDTYTPVGENLIANIADIDVQFDETTLGAILAQIVAEEKHYIRGNLEQLHYKLEELHEAPWHSLENVIQLDTAQSPRSRQTIWLSEEVAKTKTLHFNFILDADFAKNNRNLLPLFEIIANILLDNLVRSLSEQYGYYRSDNSSTYTPQASKVSQKLSGWVRLIPCLTDEQKSCKEILAAMFDLDIIPKMCHFFANSTYDKVFEAPDEIDIFKKTNILVGAEGWRQIGIEENVKKVLSQTSLSIRYGKDKQALQISELL